jgi:hypothetical protein
MGESIENHVVFNHKTPSGEKMENTNSKKGKIA